MNETIQLLSSMSPKVQSKYNNFRFKKGKNRYNVFCYDYQNILQEPQFLL